MRSVTRSYRYGAALVAAAMLAACSGGTSGSGLAGSGVTPSTQAGSVSASATTAAAQATLAAHKKKQQGKARIMITIPLKPLKLTPLPLAKLKQHGKRSPKYISASTQSMTVVVSGVPTQTFNLTPNSPGCSTSGGSTSCSETAFFPTGEQTVTITLFDQQNGGGNQLSTASTLADIAAGAVTNISITLNGVPAMAKVLLNGSASDSIPEGTATSVPASVTAYDADNNVIMTPGSYSTPVTLSDSDASGTTTLSTTSVSAPGAAITVSYNGGTLSGSASSATITPSVNGTSQPAGAATLTLSPPAPTITEYSLASKSYPGSITSGPNGALWFTEQATAETVGEITTSGAITTYAESGSEVYGIAATPSNGSTTGTLWFTICNVGKIGELNPVDGTSTSYSIPGGIFAEFSGPVGITLGPDGALWFTEASSYGNQIGRITTNGTITEYSIPTSNSTSYGITAGPDDALWFTEQCGNKIGRITTGGTITEYSLPTSGSLPFGITAGPDQALWFTEQSGNKVGRITTGGAIAEYSVPTSSSKPWGITTGPDQALWFTEYNGNKISRITTGGAITEYSVPTSSSEPFGIAAGPDQALWFTEYNGNKIGRIAVGIAPNQRRLRHPVDSWKIQEKGTFPK